MQLWADLRLSQVCPGSPFLLVLAIDAIMAEGSIRGRVRGGMAMKNDGRIRSNIARGTEVLVVLKRDQRTGKLTRGVVKDLLTRSESHPRGIKVRLEDGRIGRVREIVARKTA